MPTAGWYEDAQQAGQLRWWDGEQWTADTRPMGAVPPPPPGAPPPQGPPPLPPPPPAAPLPQGPQPHGTQPPQPYGTQPSQPPPQPYGTQPSQPSAQAYGAQPPQPYGTQPYAAPGASAPAGGYPGGWAPPGPAGPAATPGWGAPPPAPSPRTGRSRGARLALIIGAAVLVVAVAVAAIAVLASGGGSTKRVTGPSAVTTPPGTPSSAPAPGTTVPTTPATALPAGEAAFLSGLRSSGGKFSATPAALVTLGRATCGHLTGGANFVDTWYYAYQNAPSLTGGALGAIESESLLVQAAQHLCNSPANARALSNFQTDVSNFDGDLRQYKVTASPQQEIAGQEATMTCSQLDGGQTPSAVFHGLVSFILGPAQGVISQKQAGEVSTLAIRSLCDTHFSAWYAYLQAHYGS